MTGGDPPFPPSRPPYHSWHGRPSHRRRAGPPSSIRNGWVGRRPRSPPLPPPRSRHLRPPYKYHRHFPQSSPTAPQNQQNSSGYHPHGPPPSLARGLQGRLRSPPRSPPRHSEHSTHRVESQPYRGEPGPSHRIDPADHVPFRGSDLHLFRPPSLKTRGDSFSFSSERPSLRAPPDPPLPYRGEPGPLYRADSVPHRDEFEPRRGLGGPGGGGSGVALSNRSDATPKYNSWFRQPGKIHKTLKPKKRRPAPHLVSAVRASGSYMSRPQSPSSSRSGLPAIDRGLPNSRTSLGVAPGPLRRGSDPSMTSPKFSHDLASPSRRAHIHDSHGTGATKQRRAAASPRQDQSLLSTSSPDELTNNDRQKWEPNGSATIGPKKPQSAPSVSVEKRPRTNTHMDCSEGRTLKQIDTEDGGAVCNGMDWSHANGANGAPLKATADDHAKLSSLPSPDAAIANDIREEANGYKAGVGSRHRDQNKLSVMKTQPRAENLRTSPKREGAASFRREDRSRIDDTTFATRMLSTSQEKANGVPPSSDSTVKDDQTKSICHLMTSESNALLLANVTKWLSPNLQSANVPPAAQEPKTSEAVPQPTKEEKREALPSKGRPQVPHSSSTSDGPISVPAPEMSFMRSTLRPRARSSLFEGKLGSLTSFGQLPLLTSPPVASSDFSQGTDAKTGVASAALVKQIHDIEGQITALERSITEMKQKSSRNLTVNDSIPESPNTAENNQVRYAAIARRIVADAEASCSRVPASRSKHPLHSEARLLLVRNQAVAAASHAELRTLCSNVELGLDRVEDYSNFLQDSVPADVKAKIAAHLRRERSAELASTKERGREYASRMRSWREKLRSDREKMTKEQLEACRERDRYILLCTKGTSALLTSRTSSGRTSTKVVPSVAANGQTNGTAELDHLLKDIEAEGGTPGSRLIWSKTLAEIPNQDVKRPPPDCFSVLMIDPVAEHHAARAVNPWRFEEVVVFLNKYLTCSKNFIKVASFLEHKSPRDCSYFYYLYKLRLGLKQLTKDASAMKRRGTLRRHIAHVARQFCFMDPVEHSTDSHHVTVQNAIATSAAEKFNNGVNGKGGTLVALGAGRQVHSVEKRSIRDLPLKRSERIMNDVKAVDLTGIDRRSFALAMAAHGTDWKAISSYLGLPGKSSTHYREFFRRNKRKLEVEDIRENNRSRLLLPSRTANLAAKHSPRVSPRSSPRHSGMGSRSKSRDAMEAGFSDPMQLDTDNDDTATKILIKDDNEETLRSKSEEDAPVRPSRRSEREAKKGKPTATWTAEECNLFRTLFKQHGRDWKAIARLMSPKTPTQIKGYWRTVAHEVGDGLVDGPRSRSERKRVKRRTSSETLSRHSPNASQNDLRGSPETRSPILKDHEGVATEQGELDLGKEEDVNVVSDKDSSEKKDLKDDCDKPSSSSNLNTETPNGTPTEAAMPEEPADSKKTRLPMLRSLPMPLLRSVPSNSNKVKSKVQKDSSTAMVSSIPGRTMGRVASNEDELRQAAESYGVLELLGTRVQDSRDGESKPR